MLLLRFKWTNVGGTSVSESAKNLTGGSQQFRWPWVGKLAVIGTERREIVLLMDYRDSHPSRLIFLRLHKQRY